MLFDGSPIDHLITFNFWIEEIRVVEHSVNIIKLTNIVGNMPMLLLIALSYSLQ